MRMTRLKRDVATNFSFLKSIVYSLSSMVPPLRSIVYSLLSIVFFVLSVVYGLHSQSLYYYEQFNNWTSYTANGWNPDYRYGRDGVFYPSGGTGLPSTNDISAGQMRIYGVANNGVLAYNNYWVGRVAKFVPQNCPNIGKSISATPERPFGFLVVRYGAIIDVDENSRVLTGYHQGDINVWIIENQDDKTNEWDVIDNFAYFFEKSKDNLSITSPDSAFGYYYGSEFLPSTSALVSEDGTTYDFSQAGVWRRNYDDDYGSATPPAPGGNDPANDGDDNSYYSPGTIEYENTNPLGIKIIHTGNQIKFYLNPNPIDGDGFRDADPNAYFLLGSVNVGWNTNLAIMIGHENLYFHFESADAIYDDFLIRSVASNVVAEVSPTKVRKNSTINFIAEIKGTFSTNDSGIGEIKIVKPATYGDWNYANINIYTNDVVMGKVTGSDANPAAGNVALITNGSDLKIRFNKTSGAANDIIDYYNNKVIKVEFELQVPVTPDATGKEFEVYVNNEKYGDTGGDVTLGGSIKYATTGWQKALPGDAGTNVGTSSLLVKSYNDPQAYAGITVSPTPVYEDNSGTVAYTYYYEFSTTGVTQAPDISKIIINYPIGVNISASNVSSLLLQNDTSNIYVSNNQIIIDYYNDPAGKLPSPNGYDRITITGYGTPDLPLNTLYTDYQWSSVVSAADIVVGSSNQYTTTNSTYPSQDIRVIITSPEITCSVDLTNGVGVPRVSNAKKTNTFIYTVYNTGTTKILKLKINLPSVFTNGFNFSSDIIGTNINYVKVSNLLYLDYLSQGTNLSSGTNNNVDNIVMRLVHNRNIPDPVTNVNVFGYADNGNTEGWVAGSPSVAPGWSIEITPPDPSGQASIYTNIIYTTISTAYDTNSLTYTIWNDGASGNNLGKAKIYLPPNFEAINVSSSHITNDGTMITTNGNVITLDYANDANGVLKSYLEVPTEKDVVTIQLRHNIDKPTNFVINSKVSNVSKTNWADTTEYPGKTKTLTLEYPPVDAKAYVIVDSEPINNIIDSATSTNALTYVITNSGKIGNKILRARIYVPVSISTNIINIASTKINDDGSYVVYDKGTGTIYLNYEQDANGPLLGGQKDTITFTMIDYVTGEGIYAINSKVSNNREMASCNLYSGKSLSITFDIPDADAAVGLGYKYIYTKSSPSVESFAIKVTNRGKGSNYLKKLKILFPSLFNGKVSEISSSYLGATSPQPYMNVYNSYGEILYDVAGNELVSSGTDIITITYTNDFADTNTANWDVNVDNGDGKGYVATLTIPSMTKEMKIIVPVDVNITPTEVYTTSTNIQFTYTIHNGVVGKSVAVKKAKVNIPYPFDITDLNTYSDTWSGSSLSIVSNYVFLDYSSANLSAGGQDIVTLVFDKISNKVTINARFECKVDYGYAKVYRDTVTVSGKTDVVSVIYPPADSLAYSVPNNVGKDIISSPYTIYLKNVAGTGNYLYQAKITPPAFITNITSLTSLMIGTNAIYSNNTIILRYHKYGTNIGSLQQDEISFIGMDNVNVVTQGTWQIEVNNTTNTNGFTTAAAYPGKSLSLSLYQPSYNSYFYVEPNLVDSTYRTNVISINVKNVSGDSSKINELKIYLPTLFRTNNLQISNSVKAAYSISSNAILIDYSASNSSILPNNSDTVKLYIEDTIDEGSTNTYWVSEANYDSSGFMFITNNITPGKSVTNYFYMPAPVYSIDYNVDEIYTTTTNFAAIIDITNNGVGTHKIKNIEITVPDIFTNGFGVGNISSVIASNIQKNGNIISLQYTNFLPKVNDRISLSLLNTNKSTAIKNFNVVISNGYETGTNLLQVKIATPASASVTPQSVSSTSYSNDFTLLIKNDGSGVKSIYNAIIYLPNFITNVKNISSLRGATIKVTNFKMLLDYTSVPIVDGDYDSIEFTAIDSLQLQDTNVIFEVAISNSFGNSLVSRDSTNNLKVSYTAPAPEANAYIYNPLYVYTTKETNILTIKITNYGVDLNELQRVVVNLPGGISTNGAVASSHISSDVSNIKVNNSSITLYYSTDTNGYIKYQETDTVIIPTVHSYSTPTNVNIVVLGDNGKYLSALEPTLDTTLNLKVKYPEEPSLFYVIKPTELWTIDTNVWVKFHVINSSYDNGVEKLYITVDTNVFKVNKIGSQFTGSNNFSYESNYVVIDYSAGSNLPTRTEEDLWMNLSYHYSTTNTFIFEGKAVFEGNSDKILLDVGSYSNKLPMKISDFGRIVGTVIPKGFNVTVELLDVNNNNITNKIGEYGQSSINPDTGEYMIDWVLPGTYNLRFISEDFRITYYNGVTVYSNKYTTVSNVVLRNILLNNSDPNDRVIPVDDQQSSLSFPAGSILEDFYLDIYKESIDSEMVGAISKNSSIFTPQTPTNINIFDFVLQNSDEQDIDEIELNSSVTIKLHYTDAEIAAQGWSEDSLAIYYWKENTGEWVRVGGVVDKANNIVTVKVDYLHTAYAIFGSSGVQYTKIFGDLKVWPKIFTPGRGGDTYGKCKISFIFQEPVDEFKFTVFDLKGNLIYEKVYNSGPYYQAEIPWSGKDNDGFYVKSGVYIYRIIVGDKYYKGTVMVVK